MKNVVICCDGTSNEYGRNNQLVAEFFDGLFGGSLGARAPLHIPHDAFRDQTVFLSFECRRDRRRLVVFGLLRRPALALSLPRLVLSELRFRLVAFGFECLARIRRQGDAERLADPFVAFGETSRLHRQDLNLPFNALGAIGRLMRCLAPDRAAAESIPHGYGFVQMVLQDPVRLPLLPARADPPEPKGGGFDKGGPSHLAVVPWHRQQMHVRRAFIPVECRSDDHGFRPQDLTRPSDDVARPDGFRLAAPLAGCGIPRRSHEKEVNGLMRLAALVVRQQRRPCPFIVAMQDLDPIRDVPGRVGPGSPYDVRHQPAIKRLVHIGRPELNPATRHTSTPLTSAAAGTAASVHRETCQRSARCTDERWCAGKARVHLRYLQPEVHRMDIPPGADTSTPNVPVMNT